MEISSEMMHSLLPVFMVTTLGPFSPPWRPAVCWSRQGAVMVELLHVYLSG
jgi:hypothetical protein